MSRPHYPLLPLLLIAVLSLASPAAAACQPASEPLAGSREELAELDRARSPIDPSDVDQALLAEAVFFETNLRRAEHGLPELERLPELDRAACLHSQAMVEGGFFAHQDPDEPDAATPFDRVSEQGLRAGFVAENIGEVFALQYRSGEPVFTREEGGQTLFSREPGGDPLDPRSYLMLASQLLDSWMESEGHRENVLAEAPSHLGAGCRLDRDEELDMPMFVCTQLFFAPLERGG